VTAARALSDEERADRVLQKVAAAAPIGKGIAVLAVLMGLMLAIDSTGIFFTIIQLTRKPQHRTRPMTRL
jgi:hypothetical protein